MYPRDLVQFLMYVPKHTVFTQVLETSCSECLKGKKKVMIAEKEETCSNTGGNLAWAYWVSIYLVTNLLGQSECNIRNNFYFFSFFF